MKAVYVPFVKSDTYKSFSHPKTMALLNNVSTAFYNVEAFIECEINCPTFAKVFRCATFLIHRPLLRVYQTLLGSWNWKLQWLHLTKYHTI